MVTHHVNVQLCGEQQQQLRERCVKGEHLCSAWGCLLTAPSMTTDGLGSSQRFRDSLVSGANSFERSRVVYNKPLYAYDEIMQVRVRVF